MVSIMIVQYYQYIHFNILSEKRNTILKMTFKSDLAIERIFSLFDKWGHENYIGENVTQLQHSQQVRGNNVYILHTIFHKKGCFAS